MNYFAYLRPHLRPTGQRELQVILTADRDVIDQAAPHSTLEGRHLLRQFLQRGIEESFKITKSSLTARPVYVSREDHIHAHFLTCFVALTLTRILEMKIDRKYCANQIIQSLRKSNYTHLEQNYYVLDFFDDVLKEIGNVTGIDFSKKYRTLSEIKKNTGYSKKG